MKPLVSIFLWSAITVGVAAASAALYGRYRPLPAFLTGPNICRLEDNGCQVLFRTPDAALLGVPNSLLGLIYYLLLVAGLSLYWPGWLLVGAATVAFAMSLYLGFLLLKNRLECRICWTGHAANAVLWITLAANVLGKT